MRLRVDVTGVVANPTYIYEDRFVNVEAVAIAVLGAIVGAVVGYRAGVRGWRRVMNVGPAASLSAVLPLLVAAVFIAALISVVAIARWHGTAEEWWAQGIAAGTLIVVSCLLYGTGPRTYTAREDIGLRTTVPPGDDRDDVSGNDEDDDTREPGPEPLYRVGDRLTTDQYEELTPDEREKVEQQRGLYFRALYIGADGRWSTSKLQALLWTYSILYALISLFVAGELGMKFGVDAAQLKAFGDLDFDSDYMLLLGGPFAAVVAAKGITASKVEAGAVAKPPQPEEQGPVAGLREIVSNDRMESDLLDFQFFFFNVVALCFFFVAFVPAVGEGLPDLPTFLVALTSGSALAYLGKKAVEGAVPSLATIVPSRARPGEWIRAEGFNFVASPELLPTVTVDGLRASVDVIHSPRRSGDATVLRIRVPRSARAGEDRKLVVVPQGSNASAEATLEIVSTAIDSIEPTKLPWEPDARLTIVGSGFGTKSGRIRLGQTQLSLLDWRDSRITAALPSELDAAPPDEKLPLVLEASEGTIQQHEVEIARRRMTIVSVTPDPLEAVAGKPLEVIGEGFGTAQAGGRVILGETPVVVRQWGNTRIAATLPDPLPEAWSEPPSELLLTVERPAMGHVTQRITLTPRIMTITNVYPATIAVRPGDAVAITGVGFGPDPSALTIRLDALVLDVVRSSDDLVEARIPAAAASPARAEMPAKLIVQRRGARTTVRDVTITQAPA